MKRLFYFIFGIIMLLFSCNNSPNTLVGKWNIIDITQNEKDTISDLTIPLIVFFMQNEEINYVEFTNDNIYNLVNNENVSVENKKYTIKENALIIDGKDGSSIMEIIYKQADLVDLKIQANDIIISLKRMKK